MGKVTRMESRQEDLFNVVMDNLKPFAYSKNKKVIMCSGAVPLSLLYVDTRYQGMRTHSKLNRLKNNWDVRKLAPITLVPHEEEHRFAIVDGQGRYLVAKDLKYSTLQAIVLTDAPKDENERLKFEAEYFINQDSEIEIVKPMEKHLARVIIGDESALTIQKLLDKYGITFVAKKGNRKESVLGSYPVTYKIAKVHGERCLDFIFSIIVNAGWNHEPNGYASYTMKALEEMYVEHPTCREEIHEFLSDKLREQDPVLFSSDAKSKYPKRDYRIACVLHMEDLVCEGLKIKREISFDDGKIVKIHC